ncbi:MAG: CHRD domain-containing protein [Hyphomicrobium sp.]|nr:CHRD domain-containing protein [Hyphomicrobium sp.]
MATYSRGNASFPGSIFDTLDFVDLWQDVVFDDTAGTDTITLTNIDGTFTIITGTGFVLDAGVPIAGVIAQIERQSAGPQILEQITNIPGTFTLDVYYSLINGEAFPTLFGGDDEINGGTNNDYLAGYGGNDSLFGGLGNDDMDGGFGNDTLAGGSGDDIISSLDNQGVDTIDGGDHNDRAAIIRQSFTADQTADFSNPNVMVTLQDGTTIVRVERISFMSGSGNDTLTASNDATEGRDGNSLDGGAGNDTLFGSANGASLWGGTGNDSILGESSYDYLYGGEGNDSITDQGNPGAVGEFDLLVGGDGDDTINVNGNGNYEVYGDEQFGPVSGHDIINVSVIAAGFSTFLSGGSGNDTITGGSSDDTIEGDNSEFGTIGGDDSLTGGAGNDILTGNGGDDTMSGGTGDDQFFSFDDEGSEVIDGGDDTDLADIQRSSSNVDYVLDFSSSTVLLEINDDDGSDGTDTTVVNVEHISFTAGGGDDLLFASNGVLGRAGNLLFGRGGADQLFASSNGAFLDGGDGNDTLQGSASFDRIIGGLGNDSIQTGGNDGSDSELVEGNSGDDDITAGLGDHTIYGQEGADTINLGAITAGFENYVDAGPDNDTITGSAGNDTIRGGAGDDVVKVGLGDDVVSGGVPGNDTSLRDTLSYVGITGRLTIDLANTDSQNTTSAGFDTIDGFENLIGGSGNDSLFGNSIANRLEGDDGDDEIDGRSGADDLHGGAGNDTLVGGGGNDVLSGGTGNDSLNGGNDFDIVSYGKTLGGVAVNLSVLTSQNVGGGQGMDIIANVEGIIGSQHADTLTGDGAGNTLAGNQGNDTLKGGAGADTLTGGTGNDAFVWDGQGLDTISDFGSTYFEANLLGTNEVTPNASTATGSATLVLNLASTRLALSLATAGLDWDGLQTTGTTLDNVNGFHFHNADAGVNGPVVHDIPDDPDTVITASTGIVTSVWSSTDASGPLTATLAARLKVNGLYLNVHTVQFGGGEIRGQILATGPSNDRIDVSMLNIGSFETIQSLLSTVSGNARIQTISNGVTSSVTLTGVATTSLLASHFQFAGAVNETRNGTANVDYLFGAGGNDVLNGLGGADKLFGETGNDTLDGGNDAVADTLMGGAGNDTYALFGRNDSVVEATGGGTDTVRSTITRTLGANFENLLLEGAAAINGTGNALVNRITGNSAANTLDGGADTLADTLTGGGGNDTYALFGRSDSVVEAIGGGTDTVRSTITRTLVVNVENLTLEGSAAINGFGNTGLNRIVGNSGTNLLNGASGNDTLTGSGGSDAFIFTSALGAANIDHVTDYNLTADRIHLENAVFTGLAAGALAVAAFQSNATGTATQADDRIIYNTVTGALLFDADGAGGAAARQFAVLTTKPAGLNAGDFLII